MANNSTAVRFINPVARFLSVAWPGLAARLLEQLFLTPVRWRRPPRELGWMASASSSTMTFDGQRKLRVLSWGAGPTVLLVHGWSGRGSQLGAMAAPLVQAGFRAVAFDAPGHGDSDGRLSGLPDLALAVERVAAREGPLHGVVAHSLGTAATSVALSRGLQAGRLVYIAPPDDPGGYLHRAGRTLGFSAAVTRRAQARIEARYGVPFDAACAAELAPGMSVPLLVIHDREDREVDLQEGTRLTEAWPGAALVSTRGLGHRRILRAREVVELTVGILGVRGRDAWVRLARAAPAVSPERRHRPAA